MKAERAELSAEEKSGHKLTDGTSPILVEGRRVLLIDQRLLPDKTEYFDASKIDDMCFAIKEMVVRGAPSIGVAAAFGMASAAFDAVSRCHSSGRFIAALIQAKEKLDATRPTAVNLTWATEKMFSQAEKLVKQELDASDFEDVAEQLFRFALRIMGDHLKVNKALSDFGSDLIPKDARILTHCNAGSLATCGWGTALGVIRSAALKKLNPSVFVDETRPRNQGSRLTMWELTRDGIPATLICDSMSGQLMARREIDCVIVGADRIAVNGDTANKIGTYTVAVLAKHHGIPFYVAAPLSTVDPAIASGDDIPIEFRDSAEVKSIEGHLTTLKDANALNPAFDVTPASLISAIITEAGVWRAPFDEAIKEAFQIKSSQE